MNHAPSPVPDIPAEYAGKWIAWNDDRTEIIASGRGFREVWEAAKRTDADHPLFEKVIPADVRFVGVDLRKRRAEVQAQTQEACADLDRLCEEVPIESVRPHLTRDELHERR